MSHPLLRTRDAVNNVGLVEVTPDRGLCGGLITNINRAANRFVRDRKPLFTPTPSAAAAVTSCGAPA